MKCRRLHPFLMGVLLMALSGCFKSPDVNKIVCTGDSSCPDGYTCTIPAGATRGACVKRTAALDVVASEALPTMTDLPSPDLRPGVDVTGVDGINSPIDGSPMDSPSAVDLPAVADVAGDVPVTTDLPSDIIVVVSAPDVPPNTVDVPPDTADAPTDRGSDTNSVCIGACCSDSDCTGVCQTCSLATYTCVAVTSADDPNGRCAGTCDATGVCKGKKGQACTAVAAGCISGTTCTPEGICCDKACAGSCEACDVAGAIGTCTTLGSGATPHTGHTACTATTTECAGKCNGSSSACSYDTGTCGVGSCSGSTFSPPGACVNGTCVAQPAQLCQYRCSQQGTTCDDTDRCSPNPCQNGATCMNTLSGYGCSCAAGFFGTNCDSARFEWLGLNGAAVLAISADGSTVVGSITSGASTDVPAYAKSAGPKPNWVPLAHNAGAIDTGVAWATNTDGSVIVGQAMVGSSGGAFRWTAVNGLVLLGYDRSSVARAVSGSGTVVIGRLQGTESAPRPHAFRWQSGATEDLGAIGTDSSGDVWGASADGTVIVGGFTPATTGGVGVPYRWTLNGGFAQISSLIVYGNAAAVSLDGTTIVGSLDGAFRYTNNGGFAMMSLGSLTDTAAYAVNGNGTLAGGVSRQGAWLWDTTNGVRLLADVMAGFGVDLSNWSSLAVRAISSDGKTLAGSGYRSGAYTSWIARL